MHERSKLPDQLEVEPQLLVARVRQRHRVLHEVLDQAELPERQHVEVVVDQELQVAPKVEDRVLPE